MGVKSKLHRYRDPGQKPNERNIEEFGKPVRSLFTSTKVLSFKHEISITDQQENVVYRSHSKVLSLRDKTEVETAQGKHIAHIEAKIFTFHARHYVTMHDGLTFEISRELLHVIKDIHNIEGLGWQLRGNMLGLNFQLYDENENIIAIISQKMLSLHDKYCIDIYQADKEEIVIAILVTLQHMMVDRAVNASSSASSTSSS